MRPRDFYPLGLNTLTPWGEITKITFRNALYLGQFLFGLHNGIGPPSNEGTIGAATATYVQTNPTIRNNILTARFMDCFSLRAGPLGAGTLTASDYYRDDAQCPQLLFTSEDHTSASAVAVQVVTVFSRRISATYDAQRPIPI